jgi:hypothetical protein
MKVVKLLAGLYIAFELFLWMSPNPRSDMKKWNRDRAEIMRQEQNKYDGVVDQFGEYANYDRTAHR